ncbi:MAG TPA: glycosyltransferase family 1 protein [Bryobacterales bacterium]|nr:glycosyltransferase family 1 protein [Bryobacterales bacterium]
MLIGFDIRRSDAFGVGTYSKSLLRALARCAAGEEFVLVGGRRHQSFFRDLPENFRFLTSEKSYGGLDNHVRFQFALRPLSLDVFHVPHRTAPYFLPCPYVTTVHDLDQILFQEAFGSRFRAEAFSHVLRHGLRRADRIIAVSEATKHDLVALLGVPAGHIEVVHNAIDEQFTRRDAEADRRRTLERYQVDYPFLLYVGNIQPQKNLPRLVEAFAVVQSELEQHPRFRELRLIIIGDELASHPDLRRSVIRSRVQHRVRFLGFVPVETLRIFYSSAAAFVFPSLYEGFGLPPLEAMAQGTPVVTSNVSSLPEVVGEAAVLVNPENVFDIARGIKQALVDDDLREALIARGREQAARFSWDRAAQRVLEIYREVASKKTRSKGANKSEKPRFIHSNSTGEIS